MFLLRESTKVEPGTTDGEGAGGSARAPTGAPGDSATMARVGALFLLSGALIAPVAVIVPHGPGVDEPLLGAAGATAVALAMALLALGGRVPALAFHPLALAGTALATLAIHGWGADGTYGPLLYLWVAFFAFYFFSLPGALLHLGVVAGAYAIELSTRDLDFTPVAGWLATVLTLLLAGVAVATIRDRLAALIQSLTDAARCDPLTDLLNRRGFEEVFDVELERARRTETPLSLIVADLDRFKELNDSRGHAAGDAALKRVARAITDAKRSFDSAARVGGEEFALLAPNSDEHGAYMLAERIRADIERAFAGNGGALSASFGIATFPLHGQSSDALLRAADQALYAAKRLGRNRSVISSAEVPGILARAPRGHEESHVELAALLSLAEALDVRETGSTTHCRRVARYAELIARELGLAPDSVERVRLAGILHDVGRIGMPDELLRKAGPLDSEDWRLVRAHPEIGARMVATTEFEDIRSWILAHHERPDGLGYPDGRAGAELPLEARILAAADAYEAMTAPRPYREALAPDEAARELRRAAGGQFDEQVVDALLRVV